MVNNRGGVWGRSGGKLSRGKVSRGGLGRMGDGRSIRVADETADREAKSRCVREARGESDIRYDAAVTRTLDRGAICLPRKYETEIVKGIRARGCRAQRRPVAISRALIASTGWQTRPVNVLRNGRELVPARSRLERLSSVGRRTPTVVVKRRSNGGDRK